MKLLSPRPDIQLMDAAVIIILVKNERQGGTSGGEEENGWVCSVRKGLARMSWGFCLGLKMRESDQTTPIESALGLTYVCAFLIPFIFPGWHSPKHLHSGPYTI